MFAFGNFFDEVQFEAGGVSGSFGKAAEATGLCHLGCFFAGDGLVFEFLVFLTDFFHFRFNFFEIIGSDAVLHFEIVVEAVVDGGAVGELCIGPDS